MNNLDAIAESIRADFEARDAAREAALKGSRALTRACADVIRAVHRRQWDEVAARLDVARTAAADLHASTAAYSELWFSGYTQDALKEYVEAVVVYAIIRGEAALPLPEALGVPANTYLNGLTEAASELRRSVLDLLRGGDGEGAAQLLAAMDAIYDQLVTFDFHDAITGGLRRRVDALRAVLERTRGDVTASLRQDRLQAALRRLEDRLGLEAVGDLAAAIGPDEPEMPGSDGVEG